MSILKGITWNHSRAFPPLTAVSQRFEETHNNISVKWDKRTLDEFGHKPIDELAKDFDLIVIDHPWAAYCFDKNLVINLKDHLTSEQWDDLKNNAVGKSFDSYVLENKLLAIPIDTATPVPSWRPDLIDKLGLKIPESWEDLITIADSKKAIMPGFPADLFLNWLMLLHALDDKSSDSTELITNKAIGIEAMSLLKRLAEPMPKEILNLNPINIAELMTTTDSYAYCCFAYSYSNYTRPSYTTKPLQYGNLVTLNNKPLKSILGGTGIAISSNCKNIKEAVNFALYCASPYIQSGIYTYAGGQPSRVEAWNSKPLNTYTGNFFTSCHSSHENAIIRPRYNGYVALQEKLGVPLQQFILGNSSAQKTWEIIIESYSNSRMVK